MINKTRSVIAIICFLVVNLAFAQQKPAKDWFHLDYNEDGVNGISTYKLYKEIIGNREGEKVIVAVIDGGTQVLHEDLKNVIWTNQDEISNNGKDDDDNGYIDDIHGWNYIGGTDGDNLVHEQVEMVRLYVDLDKKYRDVDESTLSKTQRKEYKRYLEMSEKIEEKKAEASENIFLYKTIAKSADRIETTIGKTYIDAEELATFDFDNPLLSQVAVMITELMKSEGATFQEVKSDIKDGVEHFENTLNYYYNTEINPRRIVGDDPSNFKQTNYGNSDVAGPRGEHGTHVAGIIGAERENGVGIDGVASNIELMILRVVPDGDERDKDIALAIRYAVDNGAQVINMSFGKDFSPYKEIVDDAVKYAMKNDVLLVHAAGNDGAEIFSDNNYPNDLFLKKGLFGPKYAKTWISVGASNWRKDQEIVANFSNYSDKNVDVFAPGVSIYSTVPEHGYKNNDGTSMASPIVAGIAALLRSYFPDLNARQVKEIILESARKKSNMVIIPGGEEQVPFRRLSVSGGIANAYEAFKLALQTKGKNRKKSDSRDQIWQ